MSLIDKHFPPHHKLHKLFNRNNVKISYSCLPNIKSIINAHNRKILYPSPTIGRRTCNCINISQCPLQQNCLSNNILYKAIITPVRENLETKVYYGIWETTFKLRYANHKKPFNHREILGRHHAYNKSSKRCSLCLNEILKIALRRNNNMLNRRTKILNKYRHKSKYALTSCDSKD